MTAGDLERGREAYLARAWRGAYELLSSAADARPLRADDLELLATSAYMLGRDDDHLRALEREARVRASYGANFDQLVEIKKKYDPDNLFRVNRNISAPLHESAGARRALG